MPTSPRLAKLDQLLKFCQTGRMNDLRRLWDHGFLLIALTLATAAPALMAWCAQTWQLKPKSVSSPVGPSIFKIFFVWLGRQLSRFVEPVCSCPPSTITPGATTMTRIYSKDCPVHGCSCCGEVRDFRRQLQDSMAGKMVPVEEWDLLDALQRLTGACRGCQRCFLHKAVPNHDVGAPDAGNPFRSSRPPRFKGAKTEFSLHQATRVRDLGSTTFGPVKAVDKRLYNLKERKIVAALLAGPMFGLELAERLEPELGNINRVYPLLRALEFGGFLKSYEDATQAQETRGERPRRYYELTAMGRAEAKRFAVACGGHFHATREEVEFCRLPGRVDNGFTPVPGSCANCGATREKHLYNSYMGDVQGAWVGCNCQGVITPSPGNAAPAFRCKCTGFVAVPPPDFRDKVLK